MTSLAAPASGGGISVDKRPVVLCLAGIDPSAGAGLARDIMVVHALGGHPLPVPSALTVQNTRAVEDVVPLPADMVQRMAEAVLNDFGVAAAKVGALADAEVVAAVARILVKRSWLPVVLDPVLRSGSGHRLLSDRGMATLVRELLPLATVVTPNLREAETLTGISVGGAADLEDAAAAICAMGPRWTLVKAPHLPEGPQDVLHDGSRSWVLRGERLDSDSVHGTGCTLSSAMAYFLASGLAVPDAAVRAKHFAEAAIRSAEKLGGGMKIPGVHRGNGAGTDTTGTHA
jgi:hydroxymethylpyrimidine/phosphomethylpyrimidine kinase